MRVHRFLAIEMMCGGARLAFVLLEDAAVCICAHQVDESIRLNQYRNIFISFIANAMFFFSCYFEFELRFPIEMNLLQTQIVSAVCHFIF